jgi:hypothetical protein
LWFGWFWLFGGFGGFWAWWLFVFSCLLIHFRVSAVLYGLKLFCGLGGFGWLVAVWWVWWFLGLVAICF